MTLTELTSGVGFAPARARLIAASSAHDHLVEFYESDRFLVDSVVQFLSPALAADEGALVVATREHRHAIWTALDAAGVDLAQPAQLPRLVMLDAAETLADFMVDGAPDPARFEAVVGEAIGSATGGRRDARIFGEMVALLWAEGNVRGALAVEDLWNELLGSQRFALLCGYPAGVFDGQEHAAAFHTACAKHLAVIPSEGYSGSTGSDDQLRTVALLQQEARAGANESAELRRRTEELEAELDRLHELDRLRSEFVAMVAHDIRNPTAAVSALLGFLQAAWAGLDEDEIQECLVKALSGARRIERLTNDILALAELESGAFTYELRPVDLGRVAERVVNQVRGATGRSIDLSFDPGLPAALADVDRQVQILDNLLTNAVNFSPDTSIVSVTITSEADRLAVSVRDEGCGIAAHDMARLFQPFSRLTEHRVGSTKGTGLGLAITKALVEGQGGAISVESVEGRGSVFTYTVPTAEGRA